MSKDMCNGYKQKQTAKTPVCVHDLRVLSKQETYCILKLDDLDER